MGRGLFIIILVFLGSGVVAQQTITFKVRRSTGNDMGQTSAGAVLGFTNDPDPEFRVRHLVSWFNRMGLELQNKKAEGMNLPIVSFEYGVNMEVDLQGVHNEYNPWDMYQEMLKRLRYIETGDRVYIGWLRVRTSNGEVLKVPDLKFIKKT